MSKHDSDTGGFSKVARGLADLFDFLVDLEAGGAPRTGRREKNGMVVEFSFGKRTLADSADANDANDEASPAPQAEPRRRARRAGAAFETVEPVTDLFDEPDELVLLFELPGVGRKQIDCRLDGDILQLDAAAEGRHYRKEVLIEAPLAAQAPRLRLRNGVLEVRLVKRK